MSNTLSLRHLLPLLQLDAADVRTRAQRAASNSFGALPPLARDLALDRALSAVDGLLDANLLQAFLEAWLKLRKISQAREASLMGPTTVALKEHAMDAAKELNLEIVVNDLLSVSLGMRLTLQAKLELATITFDKRRLSSLRLGKVVTSGILAIESVQVWKQNLVTIPLSGELTLGAPEIEPGRSSFAYAAVNEL